MSYNREIEVRERDSPVKKYQSYRRRQARPEGVPKIFSVVVLFTQFKLSLTVSIAGMKSPLMVKAAQVTLSFKGLSSQWGGVAKIFLFKPRIMESNSELFVWSSDRWWWVIDGILFWLHLCSSKSCFLCVLQLGFPPLQNIFSYKKFVEIIFQEAEGLPYHDQMVFNWGYCLDVRSLGLRVDKVVCFWWPEALSWVT